MAEATRYVVIGVIVFIIALIIGLVATSLKKLASDEGEAADVPTRGLFPYTSQNTIMNPLKFPWCQTKCQ